MPNKIAVKETRALSQHYRPSNEEVLQFIERHPYLVPLLLEAPQQIFSIFGKDAEWALELHKDPEEAYDELFVVIKTKRIRLRRTVELLEKLDKWFLRFAKDIDNKLNFAVEGS